MFRGFLVASLIITLSTAHQVAPAPAWAGHDANLDPSFGTDGRVATAPVIANAVAQQADGKIVVAGWSLVGSFPRFSLARYDDTGALDPAFASGGMFVDTAIGAFEEVTVQADGKIVAVGDSETNVSDELVVARFLVDGTPDAAFAGSGIVTEDLGDGEGARAVAVHTDGTITVFGHVQEPAGLVTLRYLVNGSRDVTFNGTGLRTDGALGIGTFAGGLALQPDGKPVLGATTLDSNGSHGVVIRYDVDGSRDVTFGIGGLTQVPEPEGGWVALQSDGKIVLNVGGRLRRLDSSGALDASFGDGGVTEPARFVVFKRVEVGPGDEIVASGLGAVVRMSADGRFDPHFDGDGVLYVDSALVVADDLAIAADGKLLLARGEYVARLVDDPICALVPRLDCITGFGSAAIKAKDRTPLADRLSIQMGRGPSTAPGDVGDPTSTGGTSYEICIYDDGGRLAGGVEIDRAGDTCAGVPCWKRQGPDGYRYRDRERASDGAVGFVVRGGARASVSFSGRNRRVLGPNAVDFRDLPIGIARRLMDASGVTLQVVPSDTGVCFSADLVEIIRQDPDTFEAR